MLKKISILLILSLVSQLSFAAVDNSIAVINLEKVKNDTKAGQSISQQFNDLQEKFKDKVSKLSQDFDKKKQELDKQKSILSKEAFAKKESEFQAKLADLRKDLQAEANKVEQMNQNALAEFQGIARKVIEELVKEGRYAQIFPSEVLIHADPKSDITSQVIAGIDKKTDKILLKELAKENVSKK